jgi:hypothetical protein
MSRSKKEVEAIVSAMGVFTGIISSLVELIKKFGGTMENLYRLATPEGAETLEVIARIIAHGATRVQNEFSRIISGGQQLFIDPVDGSAILADAKGIFDYVDPDFKEWGADERGAVTRETEVQVRELMKDAMFPQMFGELDADARILCLSQHQIRSFVEKYRNWLRTDGFSTFFLFESRGELFVAVVDFRFVDWLDVGVSRFEDDDVWDAGNRHRIVVPLLS